MSDYVNLNNARFDDQRDIMLKISEDKVCPFCPDNIHKYHKPPILRDGDHWLVTPNQWPYDFTETHLLFITKSHVEKLSDLPDGSFQELQGHLSWAEKKYGIKAGSIAMRFGDVTKNGATVKHLHMHIIQPSADKPEGKSVRFKIG